VGVEAGFPGLFWRLSDFAWGLVGVQAFILHRVLSVLPGFGGAQPPDFYRVAETPREA